jgi:hypothetical protein
MQKIISFFLASGSKRRCQAAGLIVWLLRLLRDAENDEMRRNSDLLDSFDSDIAGVSRNEYNAIEEEYTSCEYALSVLETAIEDLEFAY